MFGLNNILALIIATNGIDVNITMTKTILSTSVTAIMTAQQADLLPKTRLKMDLTGMYIVQEIQLPLLIPLEKVGLMILYQKPGKVLKMH